MPRRDFLRMIAGASAFASLPLPLQAMKSNLRTVSILHTTDLHGHILPTWTYEGIPDVGGVARCATQIHLWRRQNPYSLLIDAGDVYQGTQVGLSTRGQVMMDVFNHLNYDAWVIGNHEFDWGMDAVNAVLTTSEMPALSANSLLEGKPAGTLSDSDNPLSRVASHIIKEVGGFKVAVIGVTTPGMPYWFMEDFFAGFEFLDPIEPVRKSIEIARAVGVDAIVLAGHMGLRRGGDDFANRTVSLMQEYPEVVAFIGGHTHQDVPNRSVHGMPFTQANYHGIHAGRLDLTFDLDTRKIVSVQPMTSYMDSRFAIDPAILSLTAKDLAEADAITATPVGTLGKTLSIDTGIASPSEVEELIAASLYEGMAARGVEVHGVIHGLIFPDGDFEAGDKTIGDLWSIMPYENQVVTAQLNRDEILTILREVYTDWSRRNIMGMFVDASGRGQNLEIHEIFDRFGQPLLPDRRYTIAFNSYDAASGGGRYQTLRDIIRQPDSRMKVHSLQTRDALIDYFTARDVVWPVARFEPIPKRRTQAA